jgi:hypothetical protein
MRRGYDFSRSSSDSPRGVKEHYSELGTCAKFPQVSALPTVRGRGF